MTDYYQHRYHFSSHFSQYYGEKMEFRRYRMALFDLCLRTYFPRSRLCGLRRIHKSSTQKFPSTLRLPDGCRRINHRRGCNLYTYIAIAIAIAIAIDGRYSIPLPLYRLLSYTDIHSDSGRMGCLFDKLLGGALRA